MAAILVTGSNGQLGNEIKVLAEAYPQYNFIYTDIDDLNITDYQQIDHFFTIHNIQYVINCAAYTAVDKAEQETDLARYINANAVKYLSQIAKKYHAYMIHISTDYVFDGKNYKPYTENDPICPTSAYGKTKAEGENELKIHAEKGIIIRTSWLYSSFGHNFVKTILKYGKERGNLNVVFDQIGSPTYARDLAKVVLEIIPQLANQNTIETYHFSNEGVSSWYDFAKVIVELKNIECDIHPIRTEDYPLPAPRPHYSVLDKAKIKKDFNIEIPYWKDSLKRCLELIKD
ncbi:MAG: dTDP-4-dehydrorhamnose reductase [Bacteroidetes bacterium]|nr:dTDP-4-dehydrorhamnose reductase [Bacteroidota bacterium]